ncbi:MAG: CRISPR-associated helicase Cas3' [Methanocellales archaeon]|nr:CRISPR-associated helicase Cas3' [Methanocellales archaeon]MDD5485663.1 CRISPR-associated helicase Cas3' [Methanocellales archaeon]
MAKSDGKTTLFNHLLDCAKVASSIADGAPFDSGYREKLKKDLLFCAIVHDVGKSASGFQDVMYKQAKNWSGRRHEILSTAFAATFYNVKEELLFAVLTHHRNILPDAATINEKTLPEHQMLFKGDLDNIQPVYEDMRGEWYERSKDLLNVWNRVCRETKHREWELDKVPDIADIGLSYEWLSRSTRNGQPAKIPEYKRRYAALLRGALTSSDHLSSANETSPPLPVALRNFQVFREDESPRPFQLVSGAVRGDAILRAPTGSGKTKASLLWAAGNQIENGRLFYVLPYTASINAMFSTLRTIYGQRNVGLLHHKNVAYLYKLQEDTSQDGGKAKLLADLAREMYYPIRTCTPHQILRSALRGRGWEQSLIEFPGACFIFDEIHAYEPRIIGLIFAMIQWLNPLGAKFLFASATMPEFLQELIKEHLPTDLTIIEPDPTKPMDNEVIIKKRHILEIWPGNALEQLDTFMERFPDKRLLIICNHVSTAQSVYEYVVNRIHEGRYHIEMPVLIHSRFTQGDRSNLEDKILSRQPRILIATQVVEVSLNLDYDACLSEPAPIDALIQRFGRVNRYGKRDPETVVVLREQVNKINIYPKSIVEKTLQYIEPLQDAVLTEKDLIDVADMVYADGYERKESEEFERALNYPELKDFDKHAIAGVYRNWVEDVIEGTDQLIEVLPEMYYDKYIKLHKDKQWIEAGLLLVPLRVTQFNMLISRGYVRPISEDENVFTIITPYNPLTGLQITNLPQKTNEDAVFI